MKKIIIPILIFICYGLLIGFVYSLGSHFLSDGWNYIDSSKYRNLLYGIHYVYLPLLIVVGICHFLYSVVGKQTFIKAFIFSLLLGITGPIMLAVSIETSSDPVAAMGYLFLIPSYVIIFILFLVISTIISLGIKVYKKLKISSEIQAINL